MIKIVQKFEEHIKKYNIMVNENWIDIHEGFAKEVPFSGGKIYQQLWEEAGLTCQDAQEWITGGFKLDDYFWVKQWKNLNFTLQEVESWIDIGLTKEDAEFTAYLRGKKHQLNQISKQELKQLRKELTVPQNYLDFFYPKDQRNTVKELNLYQKNLTGGLDLKDFVVLERLSCGHNQLTNLILSASLSNLKELHLKNNNFPEQDLSFLKEAINLERIDLGNDDVSKINQDIYNKFFGSLEPLKDMKQLKKLDISHTDIDSGLEYLPDDLEELNCLCLDLSAKEFKVKRIERELKKFDGPDMMFNFATSLEKWKRNRQEEERRIITSLIPTERLFVIRGNLKQFINKWSKEHEVIDMNEQKSFFKKNFLRGSNKQTAMR